MEKDTTTHNGDSNKDYKVKATIENTEKCTMLLTNQKEVAANGIADINVMTLEVLPAKNIEEGIRPEEQGDALEPIEGVHISDEMVRVTSKEKQSSERAAEVEENQALEASRNGFERRKSAEEKFDKINSPDEEEK